MTGKGQGGSETSALKWCRFRCPLCGESQGRLAANADPRAETTNQLLSHVRMTADEAHGPAGSIPDSDDLDRPEEHIEIDDVEE